MQRRQPRRKPDKQQPYQPVPQFCQFLFRFEIARDKRTGEDQEAHVHEAYQLKRRREDKERGTGVLRIHVNELNKERDVEQNRFWIRQAQHQRTFHDRAGRLGAAFLSVILAGNDRPEHFAAQPQQVEGAEITHDIKQYRRGLD